VGTSRTIAVVGLRTAPGAGWRSDLATAGALLGGRPFVWLIGMIGFALRGGILLLTVPIVVLPTQVEVRFLLGGNLGSTGLSGGFYLIVVGATVLTFVAALAILYVLARIELAGFDALLAQRPALDPLAETARVPLAADRRRATIGELYVVQALGLLALLLAAVPLALAVGDATLSEILRPSSTGSIYARVAGQVVLPLVGFGVAVVVVELLSAVASRAVLMREHGIRPEGSGRPASFVRLLLAHPLRNLAVAALGWLLFLLAVGVAVAAIDLAWQAASAVFLSVSWSSLLEELTAQAAAAFLLAAVFGAGLLLAGLVSALRGALWSLASLR